MLFPFKSLKFGAKDGQIKETWKKFCFTLEMYLRAPKLRKLQRRWNSSVRSNWLFVLKLTFSILVDGGRQLLQQIYDLMALPILPKITSKFKAILYISILLLKNWEAAKSPWSSDLLSNYIGSSRRNAIFGKVLTLCTLWMSGLEPL